MTPDRRDILVLGGGSLAAFLIPAASVAAPTVEVDMRGSARGERVWFQPTGLAVAAGTTIRFVNRDPGNSHTSTAYSPAILDRQRRIPEGAAPWDSDFLLPGEAFEVTLTVPGVYDYYCQPHEMAGMVGRIVVGHPDDAGWQGPAEDSDDLDPVALAAFPAVADILARGQVTPEEPG